MRDLDNFRLLRQRKKPVLIVGAGGAGALVARAIQVMKRSLPVVLLYALQKNMKRRPACFGKREICRSLKGMMKKLLCHSFGIQQELRELVNISKYRGLAPITERVSAVYQWKYKSGQIRDVEVKTCCSVRSALIAGYPSVI